MNQYMPMVALTGAVVSLIGVFLLSFQLRKSEEYSSRRFSSMEEEMRDAKRCAPSRPGMNLSRAGKTTKGEMELLAKVQKLGVS